MKTIKAGQQTQLTVPDYCELTIRRPNGQIEIVRADKIAKNLNDKLFATIKAATAKAGKGDCLSYKNYTKTETYTYDELDEVSASTESIEKMMRYGE